MWKREDVKRVFDLYKHIDDIPTYDRTDEGKQKHEALSKKIANMLVAMHRRQTEEEKISNETREANGIGFNGADAPILTSIASHYLKKGFISPKQMAIVTKKLPRYIGQLTDIANGG